MPWPMLGFRYREELLRGRPPLEAVAYMTCYAGHTILVSGFGNFVIVLGPFPPSSQLYTAPRPPCGLLYLVTCL